MSVKCEVRSAQVDVPAGAGATALHAAAGAGHTAVVDALLEAGADVDLQVGAARLVGLEEPCERGWRCM
jgi:hypothetical protein